MPSTVIIRDAYDLLHPERLQFAFSSGSETKAEQITLGDGYEYFSYHTTLTNARQSETYELTWSPMTLAEATEMKQIMITYPIYWVPDFAIGNDTWMTSAFNVSQISHNRYKVTATLKSYHTNLQMVTTFGD